MDWCVWHMTWQLGRQCHAAWIWLLLLGPFMPPPVGRAWPGMLAWGALGKTAVTLVCCPSVICLHSLLLEVCCNPNVCVLSSECIRVPRVCSVLLLLLPAHCCCASPCCRVDCGVPQVPHLPQRQHPSSSHHPASTSRMEVSTQPVFWHDEHMQQYQSLQALGHT
jgi:hypothetical protein